MFRREMQPGLAKVFADKSDPRIAFFEKALGAVDLQELVSLRETLLAGTVFSKCKIGKETYVLTCPGGEMPGVDVPSLEAFFRLFSAKDPELRRGVFQSPFLREKGHAYHVSLGLLSLLVTGIAVWLKAYNYARLKDQLQIESARAAIAAGQCKWTVGGCPSGDDGASQRDCYLPRSPCDTDPGYAFTTGFVAVLLFMLWVGAVGAERGALLKTLMAPELNNNPRYDALLNRLCEKNDCVAPANWAMKVEVNGDVYTLRALTLLALTTFDDRLYPLIFSEFLPACVSQRSVRFGKEYQIQVTPICPETMPMYHGAGTAAVEDAALTLH